MSMPTKGKHHLAHPHHQSQHSHLQSHHIIGININQSTPSTVSHSSHVQQYNPTILSTTSRFLSHPGSDFHVPGQNFGAQPGGQVGGGGGSVGIPGGRGPPLGGIQSIGQNTSGIPPGVSSSGQPQAALGANIQPQPSQVPSASSTIHNPSAQEMGKQTHLQTQPQSIQQVFVQNPSRSNSQNYYSTGPRPQQPRNLSHRGAQSGNQSQVVGMPGVGAAGGQPTAMYPHPNIAMQPSAMYVQSQVSGLHTNPHQQNVYSMNNQMPLQYSGPPQRHQTHQNQFSYQSYQAHALLTSNLFGFTHGAQHPGYFYHQPSNAQLNLSRASTGTVGSNSQHMSGTLSSTQGTTIVPQGTLQPQPQQAPTMHAMSLPISQNDVFSGFNGNLANVSTRTKKPRTKAITDIVNPNTGKNISDEIYKDDAATQSGEFSNRDTPQSQSSSGKRVIADFASRVAVLASESFAQSDTESENISMTSEVTNQNLSGMQIRALDCSKPSQYNNDSSSPKESMIASTLDIKKSHIFDTELLSGRETKLILSDDSKPAIDLASTILEAVLNEENDSLHLNKENINILSENEVEQLSISQNDPEVTDSTPSVNTKAEVQVSDDCYIVNEVTETSIKETEIISGSMPISTTQIENAQQKSNGEIVRHLDVDAQRIDIQQKSLDGKNMQKPKNKNKVKGRDLNRRGAEKEGTDMDAFVNPNQVSASSVKIEMKHDPALRKDINKEENTELTKDIKEKDNYESRKEKDISEICTQSEEKSISNLHETKEEISLTLKQDSQKNKSNKEISLEGILTSASVTKDVVDHITVYRSKIDNELVPSIVAQKNEENSKVSEFCNIPKEDEACASVLTTSTTTTMTKSVPSLKYTYSDDQWSPINMNGKKVYGREFLMKLQNDPNSKIKPTNLPDLDVVLKDSTKTRSPVEHRFKDANLGRHESLFPVFVKSSLSAKVPPPSKKSHSGKPKANKPNVIHVSLSLREDVKLRETENAWKPTRLVQGSASEEQSKTEALYKRVRSVLNKLTPQKFDTLVNQVRELQIDTQERLQGVIDLVFEKAVDEPNFSVAYALMCKELSNMEVTGADSEDSSSANFRKLILTRCQTEFEKNTVDENARSERLREIEECSDSERKKELQMNFEEEERRIRVKSVGNIRFIGELFKQNMLTCKIMHQCIRHLLNQVDAENLECLCKLLTTIGKVLESKNIDLSDYFKQMQLIANRKGKISSRIRFMLQDVIDLRTNKWIPRRDDSNPKTMDQIQREAESESLYIQFNNATLNTPRKDERINERKRNRGGAGSLEEGGWSQPVGRSRPVYSVETSKLKNKPPSMDDMQLGSRANYQWPKPNLKMTTPNKFCYLENVTPDQDKRVSTIHLSGSRSTGPREYGRMEFKSNFDGRNSRNGSYQVSSSSHNRESPVVESSRSQSLSSMTPSKSVSLTPPIVNVQQLSEDELQTALNSFFEEFVAGEEDVEEAIKEFRTIFPVSSHVSFVQEIINAVLEKSDHHRNKTSQLLAQLLSHKCVSLTHFKKGLAGILEGACDLIIDIPRLWKYVAKILVHPVITDTYSLSELKTAVQALRPFLGSLGYAIELVPELLSEITELKGAEWVTEKWTQAELQWSDFVDTQAKVDQIIAEYKLEFLAGDHCANFKNDAISQLNIEKIHETLLTLLKDSNFDDICNWIQTNVGDRVKEPKFIRALMTAILETSVEQCNEKWAFKVENFDKLQKLIQRYVDADDYLELQCLFAVQAYISKLSHPAGLLVKIMTYLCENNVLSNEAFLAWEKNNDPAEREGKSVSLVSLNSFFIPLKEVEDISSGDEA